MKPSGRLIARSRPNREEFTTTEKAGALEEEQPEGGPEGARRAGVSESKDTENMEGRTGVRWHFCKNITLVTWLRPVFPASSAVNLSIVL